MNDTMTQTSEPQVALPAAPHPLLGLLLSQFLGAFNDHIYKMVLSLFAVSMAVGTSDGSGYIPAIGAIFVMPYLLFSGYAGHLADVRSKRQVLIYTKLLEVVAMALGCFALWSSNMTLMLTVLFLMSLQSALFSPAKYGIIPEIVPLTALSRVNGVIEMTTFLAIILGTTIGSVLFTAWQTHLVRIGLVLVGIAALGTLASFRIPRVPSALAKGVIKPFPLNPWAEIIQGVRRLIADRPLWLISLGIAYFWFLGALLQMDLLLYGKNVLGATDVHVGLLQTFIAVGIGTGSFAAGRLSGNKVELGLVPLGALGIGISALVLALLPPAFGSAAGLLIVLGMAGGLLIVPLNSFVQHRSNHGEKGRLVATINFMSTVGVLLASGVLWACQTLFLMSADQVLLIFGLGTLVGTVFVVRLLPAFLVRFCLWLLTHTLYRIRVVGPTHLLQRGPALLICNHVSFVDGFLVGASIQRFVRFIVYRGFYEHPALNWLFRSMHAIPIAGGDPERVTASLESARQALLDGHIVCIFAEGTISRTGNLLPFKRGFERIVAELDVTIIPVHLDRVWGSMFSFRDGRFLWKWPRQLPYPVTVSFGAPMPVSTTAFEARQAVMELGCVAAAYRHSRHDTLPRRFIKTAKQNWSRFCMANANGSPYTFGKVLTESMHLAGWLRHHCSHDAIIGLMAPPSVDSAIANIAVLLAGKIPVHLDETADRDTFRQVVEQCQIGTMLTTQDFLEQHQDQPGVRWVVIADAMAASSPGRQRFLHVIARVLPTRLLQWRYTKRDQHHTSLATICFTTQDAGTAQGAMLSHHNILSNLESLDQVFVLSSQDCLLGTLPLHHAFGWTLTLWFPVIAGYGVVYYANPMAADMVGDIVQRYQATLLLSTPTYCKSYVQHTPDEDFASLRYAVVGSEPLPTDLADAFQAKFGLDLLEGYGYNEMAPVIAVNVPDVMQGSQHQVGKIAGTVGHPIPGVAAKIVCPVTSDPLDCGTEGLLLVKGPNQMTGYWQAPEQTAQVIRDGWYVTGDRAVIDENGFIWVTARRESSRGIATGATS
jgi:acyl-[acyl-carrier-protein]-phospholipid O-acyltransferase/long-chain-fatty-acid--[acyl-carrier-protein] ligase